MSKNINMSVDQDGIAIIEIDVQDRPMNVITVDFADDFKNCIDEIIREEKIIGAVLTSAKNDFMARVRPVGRSFDRSVVSSIYALLCCIFHLRVCPRGVPRRGRRA